MLFVMNLKGGGARSLGKWTSMIFILLRADRSANTTPGNKQGGPGVFKGDLYFYRVDGDLRPVVGGIDTTVCPLYMMTGEYDFSCSPDDTRRTAQKIAGAEVTVMEQVGHFPMAENPRQFRMYILPVLEKISAAS